MENNNNNNNFINTKATVVNSNNNFKSSKPTKDNKKNSAGFGKTVALPFLSGLLGATLAIGICFKK